jgi:hypothetical protein
MRREPHERISPEDEVITQCEEEELHFLGIR